MAEGGVMADNVDYLPIWKKGSTPEEFFLEVAMVARKKPMQFDKVVVVYQELLPNGNAKANYYCRNVSTTEAIGLLELGKGVLIDFTSR
jgi:hypothetical protein